LKGETEARAGEIDTNLQARVVTTIQEIASSQSTTRTMKAAYQQTHSSQLTDYRSPASIKYLPHQHPPALLQTPNHKKTYYDSKKKEKKKSLINHKPPTTKDRTQHDHATLRPILRRAVTKTTANLSHAVSGTPQPRAIQNKTCSLH